MGIDGASVTRRRNESVDHLVRRFNQLVEQEGVFREYTAHVRFVPRRVRRYRKQLRAERLRERANRGKR